MEELGASLHNSELQLHDMYHCYSVIQQIQQTTQMEKHTKLNLWDTMKYASLSLITSSSHKTASERLNKETDRIAATILSPSMLDNRTSYEPFIFYSLTSIDWDGISQCGFDSPWIIAKLQSFIHEFSIRYHHVSHHRQTLELLQLLTGSKEEAKRTFQSSLPRKTGEGTLLLQLYQCFERITELQDLLGEEVILSGQPTSLQIFAWIDMVTLAKKGTDEEMLRLKDLFVRLAPWLKPLCSRLSGAIALVSRIAAHRGDTKQVLPELLSLKEKVCNAFGEQSCIRSLFANSRLGICFLDDVSKTIDSISERVIRIVGSFGDDGGHYLRYIQKGIGNAIDEESHRLGNFCLHVEDTVATMEEKLTMAASAYLLTQEDRLGRMHRIHHVVVINATSAIIRLSTQLLHSLAIGESPSLNPLHREACMDCMYGLRCVLVASQYKKRLFSVGE